MKIDLKIDSTTYKTTIEDLASKVDSLDSDGQLLDETIVIHDIRENLYSWIAKMCDPIDVTKIKDTDVVCVDLEEITVGHFINDMLRACYAQNEPRKLKRHVDVAFHDERVTDEVDSQEGQNPTTVTRPIGWSPKLSSTLKIEPKDAQCDPSWKTYLFVANMSGYAGHLADIFFTTVTEYMKLNSIDIKTLGIDMSRYWYGNVTERGYHGKFSFSCDFTLIRVLVDLVPEKQIYVRLCETLPDGRETILVATSDLFVQNKLDQSASRALNYDCSSLLIFVQEGRQLDVSKFDSVPPAPKEVSQFLKDSDEAYRKLRDDPYYNDLPDDGGSDSDTSLTCSYIPISYQYAPGMERTLSTFNKQEESVVEFRRRGAVPCTRW